MKTITRIETAKPIIPSKKKVAAYARISMETEQMNHSLMAQISYYNGLIQNNPDWEFIEVYVDDGISGTSIKGRAGFQQMLADCDAGKIDMIVTKSIQRFARNTVDLLKVVRRLKDLGIEVWFEKENIHTMSGDGELMMTILASIAQEESRSISENVKWRIRKRFEKGIPNGHFRIYGYRWKDNRLVAEPHEAEIVRLIYDAFLEGIPVQKISKQLKADGIKSLNGSYIGCTTIRRMLSNEIYTGNLLLQKAYIAKPGAVYARKNRGELPQYYVENAHEAIIPMETFAAVQREFARRKALGRYACWSPRASCFTSKIKCGRCGSSFMICTKNRKASAEQYRAWACGTKRESGAKFCNEPNIPDRQLKNVCAKALGLAEFDEEIFREKVDHVIVVGGGIFEFHFYDGAVCWVSVENEIQGRE